MSIIAFDLFGFLMGASVRILCLASFFAMLEKMFLTDLREKVNA